jgi:hypothetical protein
MNITILCNQKDCLFNKGEWSKIDIPARGIERVCTHNMPAIRMMLNRGPVTNSMMMNLGPIPDSSFYCASKQLSHVLPQETKMP